MAGAVSRLQASCSTISGLRITKAARSKSNTSAPCLALWRKDCGIAAVGSVCADRVVPCKASGDRVGARSRLRMQRPLKRGLLSADTPCKGCSLNRWRGKRSLRVHAGPSNIDERAPENPVPQQTEPQAAKRNPSFLDVASAFWQDTNKAAARILNSIVPQERNSAENEVFLSRKQAIAAFMVALALTGAAVTTEPSGAFVVSGPRKLQGEELQTVNLFQRNTPSVVYITNLAVR
jgi:hypothetical protein